MPSSWWLQRFADAGGGEDAGDALGPRWERPAACRAGAAGRVSRWTRLSERAVFFEVAQVGGQIRLGGGPGRAFVG